MSLILAVDTSAKPVSCALVKDGAVFSSFYSNTGLTHSQTLMPMIESMMKSANIQLSDLDAVAVNAGPGSFTGVRIGVSAVKGLAFTDNLPCVSVSTLESMARNVALSKNSVVCSVMDARCQQVYTALFGYGESGVVERLWEDEAISVEELGNRLKKTEKTVFLVGDGAEMCYNVLKENVPELILTPPSNRYQNAASTALVAERLLAEGKTVSAEELLPLYLRLPQAERELNQRLLLK